MQSFTPAGSPYTEDEVLAALRGVRGTRALTFRYELLSSTNAVLGELDLITACTVDYNALADIKRTAKFSGSDDLILNYLNQRIKPWVQLRMPDGGTVEWPQGVFILSTPSRKLAGGNVTRDIDGYDLSQILKEDGIVSRLTVNAGELYTDVVEGLLSEFATDIEPSPQALTNAREWDPGTSRLRIVSDLLSAINYQAGHFDANGVFVARAYVSPADTPAAYEFATDEVSIITGDVDETIDLFDIPNRWVLVKSDPDGPELVGSYTNTNPDSITSTVSRGRVILDFRTESEAPDATILTEKAERLGYEASQVYQVVEFSTAAFPVAEHADVYQLGVTGLAVDAKFSEHSWSLTLAAGATMKHTARRIVVL